MVITEPMRVFLPDAAASGPEARPSAAPSAARRRTTRRRASAWSPPTKRQRRPERPTQPLKRKTGAEPSNDRSGTLRSPGLIHSRMDAG